MTRRIFIIIGCLIITASLVFLVIWPKFNDLKLLNKNIAKTKAELQSKQDYFANLNDISEKLNDYPDQLAKINSTLPRSSQLPVLFDFLQKASSKAGLILKSIQPSGRTSAGREGIAANSLALTLSGDYSSFKNFLGILENSSRLFAIDNISFSIGESSKNTSVDFNLTIKAFSY